MNILMRGRIAAACLLVGFGFATEATAAVSEPELAQVALNAISFCVHAALYQHDGLDADELYHAVLTVEHPAGATGDCLWAKWHREGTLDRSGPNGRETRVNEALLLQVIAAYVTIPPPIPPQYLQFRVQPIGSYPVAERAAVGTLQTVGINLAWQARWADPANPDAAAPPTLTPGSGDTWYAARSGSENCVPMTDTRSELSSLLHKKIGTIRTPEDFAREMRAAGVHMKPEPRLMSEHMRAYIGTMYGQDHLFVFFNDINVCAQEIGALGQPPK